MLSTILLIVASPNVVQKPQSVNDTLMAGALAVDLKLGAEHGFFLIEDLLRDLRSSQRLKKRQPVSRDEVANAFRAQGYVQGVFDALIDGVNIEAARRDIPSSASRDVVRSWHAPVCMSETLKHSSQLEDAIVDGLEKIPRESRNQSAHMALLDSFSTPRTVFSVRVVEMDDESA